VADPVNLMAGHDIDATNVRPAFVASLKFGATEDELGQHLGWKRDHLEAVGATVSGESTYRHMELMAAKPDYPGFVLAAVALHTASTMGAVGLACRSCSTLGEAFACHGRFQHLTNRTAEYVVTMDDGAVTITEHRFGDARPGSLLISDYTILIAVQLMRSIAAVPPKVLQAKSRRATIPPDEKARYENFLGAPLVCGAEHAQLRLDAASLLAPVVTADQELATYFERVLRRAAGTTAGEPQLLADVRKSVRVRLFQGAPTAADVAQALGLGQRTFQRRLAELGRSFAEILEDTRRMMCEDLLADPNISLAEVAYLLGYTETTSFYRAFRRWHGTTPAAFRKARG
jgi:AraC-like DNA-binding protein